MRTTLVALGTAALLLLGASAAQALSITPDPATASAGGGAFQGSVSLVEIDGSQLSVQVSVQAGTLLGLDISFLSAPTNLLSAASVTAAGGVGATASLGAGLVEAQFDFDGGGVGAGQVSDILTVTYASPLSAGMFGGFSFDPGPGLADQTTQFTVIDVPEPALGFLLGAGLLGLGRRRS